MKRLMGTVRPQIGDTEGKGPGDLDLAIWGQARRWKTTKAQPGEFLLCSTEPKGANELGTHGAVPPEMANGAAPLG
jgi:hypothetical protein